MVGLMEKINEKDKVTSTALTAQQNSTVRQSEQSWPTTTSDYCSYGHTNNTPNQMKCTSKNIRRPRNCTQENHHEN
jgi:hypothetical protein